MQSNGSRALIALAAVALVVAAFFVIRGDEEAGQGSSVTEDEAASTTTTTGAEAGSDDEKREEENPQEPDVPVIEIVDGGPKGGVPELLFAKGDEVAFEVTSNTDEEIHVHGYELVEGIPAGETVKVAFTADLDGIYEIEAHVSGELLATLRVNP